jgi:hypothetical protein
MKKKEKLGKLKKNNFEKKKKKKGKVREKKSFVCGEQYFPDTI